MRKHQQRFEHHSSGRSNMNQENVDGLPAGLIANRVVLICPVAKPEVTNKEMCHINHKASKPIKADVDKPTSSGRLFFLDLGAGRVLSANADGSDLKTILNEGRRLPDGLVVDVAAGHIYWTNMGSPKQNDGSILRSDLDGKH